MLELLIAVTFFMGVIIGGVMAALCMRSWTAKVVGSKIPEAEVTEDMYSMTRRSGHTSGDLWILAGPYSRRYHQRNCPAVPQYSNRLQKFTRCLVCKAGV